jgi:hypothetical protein
MKDVIFCVRFATAKPPPFLFTTIVGPPELEFELLPELEFELLPEPELELELEFESEFVLVIVPDIEPNPPFE